MRKVFSIAFLIIAIAVGLAACNGGSDAAGSYSGDVADSQPTIAPATPTATPASPTIPPIAPPPQPTMPPHAVPDYITIRGEQLSTGLAYLETLRRGWILTDAELGLFRYMVGLEDLNLDITQISDLSPLVGLPGLTHLFLTAAETNLAPIAALADLAALEHLHIGLNIGDDGINRTDFSPLMGLAGLNTLALSFGGSTVVDISTLAGLANLTSLQITHSSLHDLTPLANLTNLTNLNIHWNHIHDIAPLAGLSNLTHINLSGNHIADINPLAGLTRLEELFLTRNQISDISALAGLTNLQNLWISSNHIADIAPLAGLTRLRELWMSDNIIRDVSPLAGLPSILSIWADGNPIEDLSVFDNIFPVVPAPDIALAANPHPFAQVLSDFLVNLTIPNNYSDHPGHSYHAVLVDMDGRGTPGMLASKWTSDFSRYTPNSANVSPRFVQRLFFIYNGQLHEDEIGGSATSTGRFVRTGGANGQGVSLRTYTFFDIIDGILTPMKSVSITEYLRDWYGIQPDHEGNSYRLSNHPGVDYWRRDSEQDQILTHEEFNEIAQRYGLHDVNHIMWELPNTGEAHTILRMEAN